MSFNIKVKGGKSVRLPTGGKYCDRDIVITADGTDLPELASPGAATDLMVGKQLIDSEGKVVDGSFTLEEEITNQDSLIARIKSALQGKIASGGNELPTQEKTVAITQNGTHEIVPDDGYALSKATVSVNVPIPDGYIKPSGTQVVAVNGYHDIKEYENVNVNVPIPDDYIKPNGTLEVTENGVHDVTAYQSVNVNVAGSGGGDSEEEVASLLGNTMTELNNSIVTSLRTRACQGSTKLVAVNLPNVTSLGSYAFYGCSGLVTCKLPKLTTVSTQTWYSCSKLQHADCGNLGNIPAQTFNACSALTELILRKADSICTLSNVNGVNNSPIGKGTGYVYVPKNLIESYASASNWSTFANQFRAIEDYPEICG